jgi:UDP-GlcNAc:undecaprenyl-phosphate GlcNAc-1-phosphate transferase
MQLWYIFFGGIVASLFFTWGAIQLFPRWRLLDFPERYHLKRPRLPYPGGCVILFLALLFFLFQSELHFLWMALLILGGASFIDDRTPLPIWLRAIIHVGVAVFVFSQGISIAFVGNPFSNGMSFDLTSFPFLSAILTVFWIVILQNAMNWFDGVKGLTVGVSGLGFLALGVFGLVRQEVSWESGLSEFLQTSFYLAGICIGAFFFFLKGRIILGDTGSQILGFLLAVLSIFAGTKIATTLLVLGLPVLDSIFVVARRVFFDRKSPFLGDTKHLHHNLSRRIGERRTTLSLLFLSTVLGSIGIFLTGSNKIMALGIIAVFIFVLAGWSLR